MNPMRFFGENPKELLWEFGGAGLSVIGNDHFVFPWVSSILARIVPGIFQSPLATRELNAVTTAGTGVVLGMGADQVGQREGDLVRRGGVGIGVLRGVVGAVQGGGVSVAFPPADRFANPFGASPTNPALPAAQAAGAAAAAAGGAAVAATAAAMAANSTGVAAFHSSNDLGI